MSNKKELGQFFTTKPWLSTWVKDTIYRADEPTLDPFAGGGDLVGLMGEGYGYDIDATLGWPLNDSIKDIPAFYGTIITNPPYLAKNSATRQGFPFPDNEEYDDLYKIGLRKCINACGQVVAIVPESVLHSGEFNDEFSFVDIREDNPFEDTEYPVCVIGFGYGAKQTYLKNGKKLAYKPTNLYYTGKVKLTVNKPGGQYTMKCIDGTRVDDRIELRPLMVNKPVKPTDRAYVCITVEDGYTIDVAKVNTFIEKWRKKTFDIEMKPFKNNNHEGVRRRCITQNQIKALIEASQAITKTK